MLDETSQRTMPDDEAGRPLPPLVRIPSDVRALDDYERRAKDHLGQRIWDHIQEGSGAGLSRRDNAHQFEQLHLVPRMLRSLSGANTETTVFGQRHKSPILLAPVAYHRLAHAEGEIATVSAATALDTTMVVSTLSSIALEDIADAAAAAAQAMGRDDAPSHWFQLYFQPERENTLSLVRGAEAAGYRVIVVTVDASIKRSDFTLPSGIEAANLRGMPRPRHASDAGNGHIIFGTPLAASAPTWEDIDWLRAQTNLPIILKGILSPADAVKAMNHGADGLVVSNHGGRVLDGAIPPMFVLGAIAEAVDGKMPILIDSGIRTGTDIFKAIALGASAVMIGRPQLHALAVAGMPGVAHMLHILRAEFELAMAQAGATTIAEIDGSFVSWAGPIPNIRFRHPA